MTSSLIGRVTADGRVISDDGLVTSGQTNNPNWFADSDSVVWFGVAGTSWHLDFTNDSCHHSVIQRYSGPTALGGDTTYNRASGAGYVYFLSNEGIRICQNFMKGEGDYVTNNAAFERSMADELYKLKVLIKQLG